MTIDELLARESIRKTMAAYTMAGDRLRIDEFLAVFTEDAVDWRRDDSRYTTAVERTRT